jgi:hypothetical protein
MGDTTPQPATTRLQSHYTTTRDAEGRLVIGTASVRGPVVGCLIPTALVTVVGLTLAFLGGIPLMIGPPAVALLFAAIAIPILVYKGTRTWVLGPDSIQQRTLVGRSDQPANVAMAVRSIGLKREIWRIKRGSAGSTDSVYVVTDGDSRMSILSVYNWAGHESRLASGGAGSLARAGPIVPPAPLPLARTADAELMSNVSEAVRELTDLFADELGVKVTYECVDALMRPR